MQHAMSTLLPELQSLEVELHHPGVRRVRERLELLLHPEFHEVGRSGRVYDREAVLSHLVAQQVHPVVASDAFSATELSPGVVLLTYRSAHVETEGGLANHTLRSSVWVSTAAGWQLRYHQGTPASETWS